ncbi:MAG TPA: NADAR family protein, partial [Devosiaceae bacterium]
MNPCHSVAELQALIAGGAQPRYLMFWGHRPARDGAIGKACMSQWFEAAFTVDGVRYPTAEHYMMAGKARLFGDEEIAHRVVDTAEPGAVKALGRKIRGFDEGTWRQHCSAIVEAGNLAKFAQDPRLREFLRGTGERVLVEASPVDAIWGIGLAAADPRAADPAQWPGPNLLGFALMRVRGGAEKRMTSMGARIGCRGAHGQEGKRRPLNQTPRRRANRTITNRANP